MNENQKMSERSFLLDNDMCVEKIDQAKITGKPLMGKITAWNSQLTCLEVELGNGYSGYILSEHASIYPVLLPDGRISPYIRAIIGKTIPVTVIDFDEQVILLSRKKLMLDSFQDISNSIGKEVECYVTGFSSFGVFVDVGCGVSGLIHYSNLCVPWLRSFGEIFNIGDKISAKVIGIDSNKYHVNLNYKSQFINLAFVLNTNDFIEVTILRPINEEGFFAYVNPNTPAVVDVPTNITCHYGDKVIARVRPNNKHPDKLKLTFVSFAKQLYL